MKNKSLPVWFNELSEQEKDKYVSAHPRGWIAKLYNGGNKAMAKVAEDNPILKKIKNDTSKKQTFENLMDTIFSRPTVVKGSNPEQEILENQAKLKSRFPLASKLGISGLPGRVLTKQKDEGLEDYDSRLQDRIYEVGQKLEVAIPKMESEPADYYDELFKKENLKKFALNEEELHQFIATVSDKASEIEDLARSPYPNVRLVAISRGSLSKETLKKMTKEDPDLVIREKAFMEMEGGIISNMNPDSYPVNLKK